MGLNTIAKVLEKRGPGYVEKLLSEEVVITEKLDTFRILFENVNGEVVFYKKDNSKITLVERTLNDIWETAFLEIPTLIGETKLPEGIRYGVAYTPVERPLRIPYTNLPSYILTDITKRENGKVVESYDYEEVTHWAGMLCMGRPPVLFEGKLNEEQIKLLIDYDTEQYEGDYNSFAELITKTLKSSYSKEDIIEGIVIKSKRNLLQVISSEFELLDEAYQKSNSSRDFYDIILLSLTEFMEGYNFSDKVLESETLPEMYIEIVNDIFVKYCKDNNIDEKLDPKYLTSPQYGNVGKLNKKFIKNNEALEFLDDSPLHEALYRVFLSSLRKYKKPYGLLSESVVTKFNSYVDRISDYTDDQKNTSDYVNEYVDHMSSLNESRSDNITVKTLKRRQPNDIDNMRVIASIQSAFLPPEKFVNHGEKRVAIYLTDYQPFTAAQMENIKQVHAQWNVPIILAAVSSDHDKRGEKFHLTDNTVLSQMQFLSNFDRTLIPSYMMLNSWNLKEIFQFARPHYEPLLLFTDKGKQSDLSLQLFYEEEIMGGKIDVLDGFNIGELENKDLLSAKRAVEDGNGSLFMEVTPKAIHNLYDQIINEYKTWEGSIIQQFDPNPFNEIDR